MIDYIKLSIQKILKNRVGNAALTLSSGTAIAQLITLLASPILTRLYSPETFGQYSVFLSIANILSLLSTLRYDSAIILAEDEQEAIDIVLLNVILCTTSSFVLLCIILIDKTVLRILPINKMTDILQWIPVYVFFLSITIINTKYLMWTEYYKAIRKAKIAQETSTVFSQIAFSLYLSNNPLNICLGRVIGALVFIFISVSPTIRHLCSKWQYVSLHRLKSIALKYYHFPTYTLFSALLVKANSQLIPLIIYTFFGPLTSGLFMISQTIVNRPLSFVGDSLQQVFYQKFSDTYKSHTKSIRVFFMEMSVFVTLVAILPAILVFVFAPMTISMVFGHEWEEAGLYLRILVPALTIKFIVSTTSLSMYTLKKNSFVLVWSGIFLCLSFLALFIGYIINSIVIALILLSTSHIVMYIIYYIFNLKFIDQYLSSEYIDNCSLNRNSISGA